MHQAARLSDAELALCSKDDSKTALRLRLKFPPRRRAIALANCYFVFWTERSDEHLIDFRVEVLESIRSFPLEWLATHGGHFEKLVEDLDVFLSLQLDVSALGGLLNSADSSGKAAIAEYIASRI